MWEEKDGYLSKEFSFSSFDDAQKFVNRVAEVAKAENHHPVVIWDYNKVIIQSSTHSAGNSVTEKDHNLTKEIDNLQNK